MLLIGLQNCIPFKFDHRAVEVPNGVWILSGYCSQPKFSHLKKMLVKSYTIWIKDTTYLLIVFLQR